MAANIIEYRMSKSGLPELLGGDYFDEARALVRQFRNKESNTQALIAGVSAVLPGDAVLDVLGYA